MKVDSKAVQKALKQIPKKQRSYLFKAVRKSQQEAERLMKTITVANRVSARGTFWAIKSIATATPKGDILEFVLEKGVAT